jgi:hypothetical protein
MQMTESYVVKARKNGGIDSIGATDGQRAL